MPRTNVISTTTARRLCLEVIAAGRGAPRGGAWLTEAMLRVIENLRDEGLIMWRHAPSGEVSGWVITDAGQRELRA